MGELQKKQYWVLKPIKYKNPDSELYRKTITPDDKLSLTFPHLSDAEIKLLTRKRIIAPITVSEIKEVSDAEKARAKAGQDAADHEAAQLAEAKKQALAKHLNQENE